MFKATLPENLAMAKQFTFDYKTLLENIEVSVQTPDLSGNDCELSGEWGPHYAVALKDSQLIRIGYRKAGQKTWQWNMLFPETLIFESPILHAVRKKTPFILKLQDEANRLAFEIFMDPEGNVVDVKTHALGSFDVLRQRNARLRAVAI